jgi:hypothetical protein
MKMSRPRKAGITGGHSIAGYKGGKYQVFEISKNGKRIIQNGLTLENAESFAQELSELDLECVYGYEPDAKENEK